jgi:hypothetical protein
VPRVEERDAELVGERHQTVLSSADELGTMVDEGPMTMNRQRPPPDAVLRLDDQHVDVRIDERARRSKAGKAGANDHHVARALARHL